MYLWVVVAIFVLGANSVEGIIGHVTSVALAPPSDAISCGTNVTITISDAYLTSANVTNIASVVLVSNTSQTTSSSECQLARNGSSYYVTIPSFSSCYKSLQKQSDNRTTVTYLVRVVTTPNVIKGVVVRDRTFVLELKCEFNSEVVVNLRPIVAVINRNDYVVGSMIRDFKAEMKLFSDFNFDTLLQHTSPYMVVSGDYIYVGVWINFGPKANTTLQAHQCWATRTMDPKGNPKYHIISDNCPRTDPLDPVNGIRVKKNFVDNQVQFAFKAFNWLNTPPAGQHIYVHCYMSVCDSQIEQNCQNSGCRR
uniref:ZP domain-containing protein n=1 Tax=Ciona savignyi TaxID=51511 RepID=H2Y947_CIOSA